MLWSFSIWSKLEKWKILISGCLMSWPQIKNIFILNRCLLLFYATITNRFSIRLWHVTKGRFYMTPAMISSVLGARWNSKALPKPNLHQEKGMVTLWWSAIHLIHYSFLNPRETSVFEKYTQQIDMHWKLQFLPRHWSTERAQFFSPTTPTHMLHNQHCKSWMNWATRFCLICHIHLTFPKVTTIFSIISTTFYRENASITSRRPKMLSKSSSKPGAWIFTWQE